MIDALAYVISEETKLPVSAVKKVLRSLPQVTLQRALEGKKTIIPGLVTIYPDNKTLKAKLSRHLKEKYRLKKGK